MKLRDTNLDVKGKEFPNFMTLVGEQLLYGGKKYAALPGRPDRESTDYIVDLYPEFIESTMVKYIQRWRVQKREEDLVKIVTYCFLLWVKYYTGDVAEPNRKEAEELRKR